MSTRDGFSFNTGYWFKNPKSQINCNIWDISFLIITLSSRDTACPIIHQRGAIIIRRRKRIVIMREGICCTEWCSLFGQTLRSLGNIAAHMDQGFSHLVGRKHQSKQNSFSKWGTGVKKTLISATCDEYFDILNVRDSSYIAVTLKWGSMVFIYGEINPLTISAAVHPMIAQSTCPCSFLFRDIWPLISLREKEESESVTNSINHFPFSSLYYTCMECKSI